MANFIGASGYYSNTRVIYHCDRSSDASTTVDELKNNMISFQKNFLPH